MRCVCLALGLAVLVPAAARAEPIPVSVNAAANGFTQSGSAMTTAALNLGTVVMPSVNSVGMLLIDGPLSASDYVVSFMLEGLGSFDTLRLELLNPKDRSDSFDPESQPDYVPKGYSTSNDVDGLSFAQRSGLERSAVFAGAVHCLGGRAHPSRRHPVLQRTVGRDERADHVRDPRSARERQGARRRL